MDSMKAIRVHRFGGPEVLVYEDVPKPEPAADELQKDGISVEVVDLRTLRPFDLGTVSTSVQKTNRIVVVEEGPLTGGWAGEVLASVVEHGLGYLDDAWRMATPDTPIPYSPPLEQAFLPGPGRIAAEIRERLR